MDFRVLSIGAMAAHPLRGERSPQRTGHATTTLVRAGEAVIVVDPGLPGPMLAQRLDERAGLRPAHVTHVFLTSFRPDTCRGITAFERAAWFVSEVEREAVGVPIAHAARALAQEDDPDDRDALAAARNELEQQVGVLHRCRPAPDRLAPGVDLFPLPGVTPGLTGLLLSEASRTTLICGDAVPTLEHLERGQAPASAANIEQARQSLAEALEIADLLILGRDNLTPNPARGGPLRP